MFKVLRRAVPRRRVLYQPGAWLAVGLLALVGDLPAQPAPDYTIRDDRQTVSTAIRARRVGPLNIAVNLPYHQLPAADREKVHAQYEAMAPGDEPPFPVNGLRALLKPIGDAQSRLLVEGPLSLIATIGPDGQAQQIKAIGSPSPEMTRFAAELLLRLRYKPAICQGTPCTMDFPLDLMFVLKPD